MMLSNLIFRIAWDFKIIIFERMFSVSSKPSLEYILLENNYFRNIALNIKHILNNIVWSGLHKNTYPIIRTLNYIIGRFLKDVTQFWNHRGHNSEHSFMIDLHTIDDINSSVFKVSEFCKRSQGVHIIEHFLFLKLRTKLRELSVRRPYREIINKQKQAV